MRVIREMELQWLESNSGDLLHLNFFHRTREERNLSPHNKRFDDKSFRLRIYNRRTRSANLLRFVFQLTPRLRAPHSCPDGIHQNYYAAIKRYTCFPFSPDPKTLFSAGGNRLKCLSASKSLSRPRSPLKIPMAWLFKEEFVTAGAALIMNDPPSPSCCGGFSRKNWKLMLPTLLKLLTATNR